MDLDNIDLTDRRTQVLLAGGAVLVGLVLIRLRGGDAPAGDEGPAPIVIEYENDPTPGPAYNGTFPPIVMPPKTGTPDPAPDPDPDPTPDPGDEWEWVDPAGKPYSCPVGSRMAMEKGGTGNHVCVNLSTNEAHEVVYSDGRTWSEREGDTGSSDDGRGYYCEPPSVLAWESTGSGNHVCRWPNGAETAVIMKNTGLPWGVGGDAGTVAMVAGLPTVGGVSLAPAPINPRNEYTVQPGDSLVTIAQRQLGASERWPQLMLVNPELRSIDALQVGRKIRLP